MGFEQPKFNKPTVEKTPANKRRGILSKLTNIAALGATLMAGELKAKDATQTNLDNTKPVATKNESRLADAKKIEEIKKKLDVAEIKVESDLDPGHKWNNKDAKIFQQLREKDYFDGSSEKQIAAAIKKENELKSTGLVQETERELLAKTHPDEHETTSSGWAHNVVFHAKDLQETARDKEDAVNLINKSYDAFVKRFQNPDPALGDSIEKNAEGKSKFAESDRSGSKADFMSIAENATKLAEIIKEVAGKHGVEEASVKPKIDELERISKSSAKRAHK